MAFELPELPYDYAALEPYIDEKTMRLHHDKHHQTYLDKLNAALEQNPDLKNKTIEELLTGLSTMPEPLQKTIRNQGGGYYNHTLFWQMLSPNFDQMPSNDLKQKIESQWQSFDEFKKDFSSQAAAVFGSGWTWLVIDENDQLKIVSTANQDSPIMTDESLRPLLGIDLWEHAYYLKYNNRRPDYIAAFWHIVNWQKVSQNFHRFVGKTEVN
ncbi:superoxide dismutase [Oenococcus alcoholitolerans]|uniref:superoxide dismutase n=1 Tax=Oenococcus alcoholitolerans TaxID=931074 RepID=UPI003F710BD4